MTTNLQTILDNLQKEIIHYQKSRDDELKHQSYKDWLNGRITGLRRAESILEELIEKENKYNAKEKVCACSE